jgi:hypothetical protein
MSRAEEIENWERAMAEDCARSLEHEDAVYETQRERANTHLRGVTGHEDHAVRISPSGTDAYCETCCQYLDAEMERSAHGLGRL